jgi:hypothetical protein
VTGSEAGRVALVIRGDRAQRDASTFKASRLAPVAKALAEVGLTPEPSVFAENMAVRPARGAGSHATVSRVGSGGVTALG